MRSQFASSRSISGRIFSGPFLIGIAALLWATDALVRYPAINSVDPTFIIFIEHLLGVTLLTPWIYRHHRKNVFSLSLKEWLAAAFCGIGGSALANVLFTASFLYVNPSVAVLLQKLQPVMVIFIAYLFLGERPNRKFFLWGAVALGAGIVLSFPNLNFRPLSRGVDLHSQGIQYALGAAFIWAASTVAGKMLVLRTAPVLATFWRFTFGLVTLIVLMALAKNPGSWSVLSNSQTFSSLLYLSLVPGLFAMLIYYSGLSRTQASITTFVELIYPIGAVVLNTFFLHTPLETIQTIAAAILLCAVTLISL